MCACLLLATRPESRGAEPFILWQQENFTGLELTDAETSGALADPDRDGIPNLWEYVQGTDPRLASDVVVQPVLESGALTMSYLRRSGLADVAFHTEVSGNLSTWATGPTVILEDLQPAGDAFERLTARDLVGGGSRFMRTSVVRVQDADAETYCDTAGVSDPAARQQVNDWYTGLKALGIFPRVKYMAALRAQHNRGSGNVLYAMKGAPGAISGAPAWTADGLRWLGMEMVTVPNPFGVGDLTQFSIVAAFDSDQSTNRGLFGSDLVVSGSRGPVLTVGGGTFQGPIATDIFFDMTSNGSNSQIGTLGVPGRRTFNFGNTGLPQFVSANFSPTEMSLQTDYDRRYFQSGPHSPAWNRNANWYLGCLFPGVWHFTGTISFVAALDSPLNDAEHQSMRRLYEMTIGRDLPLPPLNVIIEGDSLSEESTGKEYAVALRTKSNWAGKFRKRNVGKGGETSAQMIAGFPTQMQPYRREIGRNYCFFWGGRNSVALPLAEHCQQLSTYWASARSAGFKVVAFTITPTTADESFGLVEKRLMLNDYIRSRAEEYDYLIDVANIPNLQDPTNLTYYLPDGVHMTYEGGNEIAEAINAVIANP